MSIAAVRTAIATILAGVTDIGVVHAYERYATNLDGLKTLYFSAPHNQIRGWYVSRNRSGETGRIQTRSVETTLWRINGFMALSDATQSELAMDGLIEAARNTFAGNDTLNGTVDQCSLPRPGGGSGEANLQLIDFGPVMFAGVLCHGVKFQLNTIRYLTRPM